MKIKFYILLFGLFFSSISFGQSPNKYSEYVKEAEQLYESKEFKKSAGKYKEAFDQIDGKAYPNDRYNAACSYALAEDIDNSFYHLFRLAEHPKVKYKNYEHITTDTDLKNLHKNKRWDNLLKIVKSNKEEAEKYLDKPLVAILDKIYEEDQTYRIQLDEVEEKYGRDSKEVKAHWQLITETDSINLIKIKEILDERGWLGPDIVGQQGNTTLFLVIQHSDLETQVKYLPMMKAAVKEGNARPSSLALLEDRVGLGQGKRQVYGSQIGIDQETGEYYVLPLIDPENVDKRRAEVGLGSISQYVGNWDMTWDVEKHKERTKILEAKKEE